MFLSNLPSRGAIAIRAALVGGVVLVTTPCRAEGADRKECADAYAEAQTSMRSASLLKAREQLKVCARDSCLALIRKDCLAWLDEVNAGIPSVVVVAKGPDGKETFDVRVSLNGTELAPRIDVTAIELDPGTFTMRFEHPGSTPIEQEVVVRQGQKNRLVEIDFGSPGGVAGEKGERSRTMRYLPWVLGGVGVGLAGVGSFFWLSAESSRSDLAGSCAPNCSSGAVDSIETKRVVGDVLFGVGIVAIGAAAVWLLAEPARSKSTRAFVTPRGFTF